MEIPEDKNDSLEKLVSICMLVSATSSLGTFLAQEIPQKKILLLALVMGICYLATQISHIIRKVIICSILEFKQTNPSEADIKARLFGIYQAIMGSALINKEADSSLVQIVIKDTEKKTSGMILFLELRDSEAWQDALNKIGEQMGFVVEGQKEMEAKNDPIENVVDNQS